MKKITFVDRIEVWGGFLCAPYEPYDRNYTLDMMAKYCQTYPSTFRNAGITIVMNNTFLSHDEGWAEYEEPTPCICFEVENITKVDWETFLTSFGGLAVKLQILPDDWKTITVHPSEFEE